MPRRKTNLKGKNISNNQPGFIADIRLREMAVFTPLSPIFLGLGVFLRTGNNNKWFDRISGSNYKCKSFISSQNLKFERILVGSNLLFFVAADALFWWTTTKELNLPHFKAKNVFVTKKIYFFFFFFHFQWCSFPYNLRLVRSQVKHLEVLSRKNERTDLTTLCSTLSFGKKVSKTSRLEISTSRWKTRVRQEENQK